MKYSRNRINNAGAIIASDQSDILDYAESMNVIDDWRKLHLPVLEMLMDQLNAALAREGIRPAFSSQRLKRMQSIRQKLQRNSGMGLGGMQDIGGARLVFDDIPSLMQAKDCILNARFDGLEPDHQVYDYVQTPKDSGYRSIHFVYKCHSQNPDTDGMRVELQIRTRLQHDWATAVETAELISKSQLKASIGDENWLEFFKIVSAVFSRMEGMPVNESYRHYSEEDYCRRFAALDNEYQFVYKLRTLVELVRVTMEQSYTAGYALLLTDTNNKRVSVRYFQPHEKDLANDLYAQVESRLSQDGPAVVLVAVNDINELRNAYPSYFLNADDFTSALHNFNLQCRVHGYIN